MNEQRHQIRIVPQENAWWIPALKHWSLHVRLSYMATQDTNKIPNVSFHFRFTVLR